MLFSGNYDTVIILYYSCVIILFFHIYFIIIVYHVCFTYGRFMPEISYILHLYIFSFRKDLFYTKKQFNRINTFNFTHSREKYIT